MVNSTYVHIYTYTIYITSYITDAYCICRQLGISDDGLSCELLPRFNEWRRSVADLQIKHLQGTQTGQQCPDWHFLCFVNPDDIDAAPLRRHVASVLMKVGVKPFADVNQIVLHVMDRDGGTSLRLPVPSHGQQILSRLHSRLSLC